MVSKNWQEEYKKKIIMVTVVMVHLLRERIRFQIMGTEIEEENEDKIFPKLNKRRIKWDVP